MSELMHETQEAIALSSPEAQTSNVDDKLLRMEAQEGPERELVKVREIRERAQEDLDMQVVNLETFEKDLVGLEDTSEYSILRNELLRRIYESGLVLDEAQLGEREYEDALKEA